MMRSLSPLLIVTAQDGLTTHERTETSFLSGMTAFFFTLTAGAIVRWLLLPWTGSLLNERGFSCVIVLIL